MSTVNFDSHWEFLKKMERTKEYYDINKVIISFKKKLVSLFLGYYYGTSDESKIHQLLWKIIILIK
jgi:hypothetical protein